MFLCSGLRGATFVRHQYNMDALSEALGAVRMTGAIFFHAECSAPWGIAIPDMRSIAHFLSPGTERLVGFHLMTEGSALLQYAGTPDVTVASGEIIILPHGAPHTLIN